MAERRRVSTLQAVLFLAAIVCVVVNYSGNDGHPTLNGVYPTSFYSGALFQPNITQLILSIPRVEEYGHIDIEYLPLPKDCVRPKPYFIDRSNLCWSTKRCTGSMCKNLVPGQEEEIVCAPSILVIGAARSGTADLTQWFQTTMSVTYSSDYQMSYGWCAVVQAESNWKTQLSRNDDLKTRAKVGYPIINRLPNMFFETQDHGFKHVKHKNKTRQVLQVRTAMQHLQVISTEKTRYLLILRDPVERVISQIIRWKEQKYLKDLLNAPLTQSYIHSKVAKHIRALNDCFTKYGPKACIYFTSPQETNTGTLLIWGMYVEYLEEALKFIKREQLILVTLDEYMTDKFATMHKIFKLLNIYQDYPDKVSKLLQTRENKNKEVNVEPAIPTVHLLQRFYSPFNRRLVILLDDSKWCFSSCW